MRTNVATRTTTITKSCFYGVGSRKVVREKKVTGVVLWTQEGKGAEEGGEKRGAVDAELSDVGSSPL